MEIDERIASERERLLKIFEDLSDDELAIASRLIDQAAFLGVELEDLSRSIAENGTTEMYSNGATQQGKKMSSEVKAYNFLLGKYNSIIGTLMRSVPRKKSAVRVTPEDLLSLHIEHNTDAVKQHDKQKKIDEAFLDALSKGKLTQDDYKDFAIKEGMKYDSQSV